MRVGCGSAVIGIFARQCCGHGDEVVVVDEHITGVLTEHQAGRCLGMKPSGIRMRGRKSTPGRYFQVAQPGTGWGGTDLTDPLAIIAGWDARRAWPGLRLLITSTTGEHAGWYLLDHQLKPVPAPMPAAVGHIVQRIGQNCEAALSSVLFLGGAGGSLRAGVTENPVLLTRAIKNALVHVSCGGAPAYLWPGGGITVMADVLRMPDNSFGTVPTAALVAPMEFSMRRADYAALGSHVAQIRDLREVLAQGAWHGDGAPRARQWQGLPAGNPLPAWRCLLPGGRWHFQHGPMDLIIEARGDSRAVALAHEHAWLRFAGLLQELVDELPALRAPVGAGCALRGVVARRMWAACRPYRAGFITPMAAVAGAVAQEILAGYARDGIARAWVNNGGDIALHLAPGASASVGICSDIAALDAAQLRNGLLPDGQLRIRSAMPVRGVATSGWRGRRPSLGNADSVTVLARTAAEADAAATIVANAVDVPDERIGRMPAWQVRADSDLGAL